MDDRLDALLGSLARAPTFALDELEPEVWRRVEAHNAQAIQRRLSGAAVGVALALGVVAGGTAATERPADDASVFSPQAALAPSTLLGVWQ